MLQIFHNLDDFPDRKLNDFSERLDFAAFAEIHIEQSFSESFHDLRVIWESNGITCGKFIEIGAADDGHQSNTQLLEQIGWTGLIVDREPNVLAQLSATRQCDTIAENMAAKTRISNFGSKQTVSLNALMAREAISHIDYLSIMCARSAQDILSTFDLKHYPIAMISVRVSDKPGRNETHNLLTERGYVRKWADFPGTTDFFLRDDLLIPYSGKTHLDLGADLRQQRRGLGQRYYFLHSLYGHLGTREDKLRAITLATETSPERPLFQHLRGICLSHMNDWAAAAACHQEAIKLNPKLGDAYLHLSLAKHNLNDAGAAMDAITTAVELFPGNKKYRSHLAWLKQASSNI